jgi:DNA helicase-2/ATP-dependent DNA helicase PcrA
MLAGDTGKVMIVGDDDQSIYGWRGAKIENIQRFLTDYQGARPSAWSRTTAPPPTSSKPPTRHRQQRRAPRQGAVDRRARASRFRCTPPSTRWTRRASWSAASRTGGNGRLLADCAILYRSNAQSRVLEEALMQDAMPYRIYGGLRFFERQEIKDAMAYLRLINNRGDDAASSGWSTPRPAASAIAPWRYCAITPAIRARTCGNRPRPAQ